MTCERCRGFAYRNEDGDEECLHCGHVKDSRPPLALNDGYHRRDYDPEVIVEHHKATARRYMRRRYVSRQATGA